MEIQRYLFVSLVHHFSQNFTWLVTWFGQFEIVQIQSVKCPILSLRTIDVNFCEVWLTHCWDEIWDEKLYFILIKKIVIKIWPNSAQLNMKMGYSLFQILKTYVDHVESEHFTFYQNSYFAWTNQKITMQTTKHSN